jgi:twinkle protein
MEKSDFMYHAPCSECQSRDNVAVYTDGHGHCFGCGHYYHNYEHKEETKLETQLIKGEHKPLNKRHINLETVTKFNYQTGKYNNKTVQIANYYDKHNKLVAQKLRYPDKSFQWLGDSKQALLFGQNLWRDTNKKIVILEGEIDALSLSQVQGNKWACVSVKTGSQGAKKDLQQQIEWLEKAEEIVLMFDNDEPGKLAAQECSKLFTPGKCKIATLPRKDANEMLVQGETAKLIDCMWSAKTYRPDGIISGTEIFELLSKEDKTETIPYPFECLNTKTLGMRRGELITVTSGTGQGKSQLCRQIAHHLIKQGECVGYIALEESVKRTALGIMGIDLKRPLHLSKEGINKDEFRNSFTATVGSGLLYLFDHFGSTESENLLSKIRYLAKGLGVRWVILDHLSIVISGLESYDERKLIDVTMTKLRSLVEATGIGLILVSHLRRPEGNKGYEDGIQTSLNSLRGSHAISQLSDSVIALERNQNDDENKNYTTVRVLKNRYTGDTGKCGTLFFDNDTACLVEIKEGHERDF